MKITRRYVDTVPFDSDSIWKLNFNGHTERPILSESYTLIISVGVEIYWQSLITSVD